jgi:hypothetical protein
MNFVSTKLGSAVLMSSILGASCSPLNAQTVPVPPQPSSMCMSNPEPTSIAAEIEALANAGVEQISKEALGRWFQDCSFESAQEKLKAAGFDVDEYDPSEWQRQRGITKVAVGLKRITLFRDPRRDSPTYEKPVGAQMAKVILYRMKDGRLETEGSFYIEAP